MSTLFLSLAVVVQAIGFAILALNLHYLRRHGQEIPEGFEGSIDRKTLAKMSAYGVDTGRSALFNHLIFGALLIIVVFAGWLERYDQWITGFSHSFVARGVLYFLIASWISAVLSLPFELYSNFVIEQRHGFNRITKGLFWSDFAKGLLLTSVFVVALATGAFQLAKWSAAGWWIQVWALFLVFEVTVMLCAPKIIEPLFSKITPLSVAGLEADICALAKRAGVQVGRVLQVDASRRSGHTNAYFTGLGPVKRVVLFDTLLEKLDHAEESWRSSHTSLDIGNVATF